MEKIINQKLVNGVSVICACKNRSKSLTVVLDELLSNEGVDEIILVDWDSDKSLDEFLKKDVQNKVILVQVEDEPYWELSRAYNLAARFVTKNKILKLDSDIIISKDFFKKHKLKKGIFYRGNWRNARNENEKHLSGTMFVYTSDFFRVNGYNEFIYTYGEDDHDIYRRLGLIGLKAIDLNCNYLAHIPHSNLARAIHQPGVRDHKSETRKNQIRLNEMPWSLEEKMSPFLIKNRPSGKKYIVLFEQRSLKRLKFRRNYPFLNSLDLNILFARIFYHFDRVIGMIGIVLKKLSPKLYLFLKKFSSKIN